jgi:hypothetical protein
VLLENVSAQSVHLIDSVVRIYNLQVRSEPAIGITLERSELELTNAQIEARTAIRSLSSRVDVAGLTMHVRDNAVVAEGENRVIVSVSEVRSPGFQGYLHGSYKLVDASLDAQLR